MPADYPPFSGPRRTVAAAVTEGGGPVAGRLVSDGDRPAIVDASDRVLLEAWPTVRSAPRESSGPRPQPVDPSGGEASGRGPASADPGGPAAGGAPAGADTGPRSGDWVSGTLVATSDGFRLEDVVVHAPHRAASPDPELTERLPLLDSRASLVAATRSLFRERGFLEVETPARVRCPGLEPNLRAFPAGDARWLITSPELHLKRLVAAGAEKVVELARAFRDDERGPWHRSEFLLLEWYRGFERLEALEADCEALVEALASEPCVDAANALPGCELRAPFRRTTVREALQHRTGIDIVAMPERDSLARAVSDRGHPVAGDDDWDDLFFRVWVTEVEPRLGRERPLFVHDYPVSQAALARVRETPHGPVAERFELYIAGIEIANAFHELNDPDEQRRRHRADQEARRVAGAPVPPLDEAFLGALESGMPPCSGIALGLDRLIALLLGARSLDEIFPFPGDAD